jgi:hypothetical protein
MNRSLYLLPLSIGAFAAWGLWLAEIYWNKNWAGLSWVSGFNWSSIPICAMIASVSSFVAVSPIPSTRRFKFIGLSFALMLAAFTLARWAIFNLFSGGYVDWGLIPAGMALVTAWASVSIGLTVAANRLLVQLHPLTCILTAFALVLVLPLAFATIAIFPALNGSRDYIHAIKMGYPVFWTALLVPFTLHLGRWLRPGP